MMVRTTVTLSPNVHAILRAMAEREGLTLGEVIGNLVEHVQTSKARIRTKHGIPQLPNRKPGTVVTSEMVKSLSEDDI